MIIKAIRILIYRTETGRAPFQEWLEMLSVPIRAKVQARLFRIECGNFGDYKSVGHGVCELRIKTGPGYRVYLGFEGRHAVILLAGGDKRSQRTDIVSARKYWLDFKRRK